MLEVIVSVYAVVNISYIIFSYFRDTNQAELNKFYMELAQKQIADLDGRVTWQQATDKVISQLSDLEKRIHEIEQYEIVVDEK